MKKLFSNKLFGLLILLLVTSAISAVLYVAESKDSARFVCTEAVITDWKTARKVSHVLYFDYQVDEVVYHGQDSFHGNFPTQKVGDIVKVWYDPDQVSRVMISETKPDAGLWPYAPFFLAFPLALYILSGAGRPGNRRLSD